MAARFAIYPPLLSACAFGACAFGASSGQVDGGGADARDRADGSRSPAPDASSPDASQSDLPDASGPADASVDAALGAPDAQSIVDTVLITEIVDADQAGGLPKFVEITNLGAVAVDLSGYSIATYNNGASTIFNPGSPGTTFSTVLAGSLAAGASHVISFENGDSSGTGGFFDVYGFDPDNFSFGPQINGDDTVVLFRADGGGAGGAATNDGSDATIVDVYGVIGVDGSTQPWEYSDGFATRRQAATQPKAVFDTDDWGFSGAGGLDGKTAGETASLTSPGSH